MMKRIISVFLVAMLLVGLLSACGEKGGALTVKQAKALVLKDLNLKQSAADSVDLHMYQDGSIAYYVVYVSANGKHWEYTVNCVSGEIMSKEETASGHSH